jgi:beta-lactamase class A
MMRPFADSMTGGRTFKFLAAVAVLHRVDKNQEHADRRIAYRLGDLDAGLQ